MNCLLLTYVSEPSYDLMLVQSVMYALCIASASLLPIKPLFFDTYSVHIGSLKVEPYHFDGVKRLHGLKAGYLLYEILSIAINYVKILRKNIYGILIKEALKMHYPKI